MKVCGSRGLRDVGPHAAGVAGADMSRTRYSYTPFPVPGVDGLYLYADPKEGVLLALPTDYQRSAGPEPCLCGACKGKGRPMWDALRVTTKGAWTVHAPEYAVDGGAA
jgi:hypothetical protein